MRDIINYFKECYREDRSHSFIRNVFHKDVGFLRFVENDEELLASPLRIAYHHDARADELAKTAHVYRREKELLYGAIFVVGQVVLADGSREPVCAPVVFQPVSIEKSDELYVLKPQDGAPRFNYRLVGWLAAVSKPDEDGLTSEDIDVIEDMLGDGILETGEVWQLTHILEKHVAGLDTSEAMLYPTLISQKAVSKKLKALKQKGETELVLLSASCVGLFNRGSDAQGVLLDLDKLSEAAEFSIPLQGLMGIGTGPAPVVQKAGLSPSILSEVQVQLMEAAARCVNSLLIGPPGTGKSYTVATLAMNYMSQGKSVLITSGRDQAVDVIGHKIQSQLRIGGCVVRGGTQSYLKQLKAFVQDVLSGMYSAESGLAAEGMQLEERVALLLNKRQALEKDLLKWSEVEVALGQQVAGESAKWFSGLHAWFLKHRIEKRVPLWETLDDYNQVLDELVEKSRTLISYRYQLRLTEALSTHRPLLQQFGRALKARTAGKQEELFAAMDLSVLLSVFPVWLVKLADVYRVLPLVEGMFDLVIIDEATQCDIASCLPAIQRARRVVVTGDPHQLKHISFLSEKKMHQLLSTNGLRYDDHLNYRETSILDLYTARLQSQESVLFLNEHYRSRPDIIRFSNHHFYGDRLMVMTEKGDFQSAPSLHTIRCDGTRNERGVNREEVEAIVKKVVMITTDTWTMHDPPTIGILSPFRNQVDALTAALNEKVPLKKMKTHDILTGTAHSFQGAERDIMLLSLVVDDSSHANVTRFLERPDVFNVSITRAKWEQYVFYSVTPDTLPKESLLRQYLADASSPPVPKKATHVARDTFAADVQFRLQQMGFSVDEGCSVAGCPMDLLLRQNTRSLGIDLIGYPGDYARLYQLDRYRMLRRAGLTIFPLPYSQWCKDPNMCLDAIKSLLEKKRGKMPVD
ncbi:MAG: hypothetical protein JXR76_14620 [Deltaproteobacteria bacterium]|nr:hypothetical protein [Deltaproteobacteria bacterium]